MDAREVAELEAGARRTLATLDDVAVPSLADVRSRRAPRSLPRLASGLVATLAILVLAFVAGDRLNAWRNEHSAAGPTPTGAAPAGVRIDPDPRYGILVRSGDKSGVALVDELGHQVTTALPDPVQAVTSPNGRYVAMWIGGGSTYQLRVLDGVTRTLGPALFTTSERFANANEGIVWASDSTAVLLTTTEAGISSGGRPITANIRAVDLAGNARLVATRITFQLIPLAWSATNGTMLLVSAPQQSGAVEYLRVSDDGTGRVDARAVTDRPIVANDAGTYVASSLTCPPTSGAERCRSFAIHDATTYDVVARIDLPPLLASGSWGIHFRPRTADIVTDFSRTMSPPQGRFGLEVHPDAGRGPKRDLGDTIVAPSPNGTIVNPNAYLRADGSAVYSVHYRNDGSGRYDGDIVDLRTGARTTITVGQPLATVLLDDALVTPSPVIGDATAIAICTGKLPGSRLIAAFASTAGLVADWAENVNDPTAPHPVTEWRGYPKDAPAYICYFSGFYAVPHPPPPPGQPDLPYDRARLLVDANGRDVGPSGYAPSARMPLARPYDPSRR